MIYRVKGHGTILDFGSMQAAQQLLDNYPPHVRESVAVGDISSEEARQAIASVSHEISKVREGTVHRDWLMSRLEMYEKALVEAEQLEAQVNAKVASIPTADQSSGPVVNEIWRP